MAFGPNSNNPRERRAYAHAKLVQLRHGQASYTDTYAAIEAASQNRKGRTSGFKESLGNTAVVLVNWNMASSPRPGITHYNFGGFVMPRKKPLDGSHPVKGFAISLIRRLIQVLIYTRSPNCTLGT